MKKTTKTYQSFRERERVEAKSERTKNFFKKAGFLILCLILLVFTVVEASPPGSAYVPGETLAPSCSPGDTNCKVALTSGSVLFSNGTDLITQDNSNFYWDDTNNRLGIGTTTPSYKLTILGDLFVNTSSTLGNVISGTWQGTAIGDSYVSSAATWNAKITTSSLSVAYGPLSYNNATGVFSLPTSTASQSGFLSSADWTTFNNKQAAITLASSTTGTDFTITNADPTWTFNFPSASASNRGLLTSADWTTFNNKQNNISFPISVASTSLTASLPLLLTTNDLSLTGRLLTIHNIATSTGSLIAGKADTTGWYGLTIGTDAKVLMASSTATYGMSWETVALTPGGSNTQIQFNNAGAFLGDANFTWASSTQLLIITGTSTISGNLGVGTTTPVSLFTVATTTNIFNVLSSGYVGIGTSTPGYKLTINSADATTNLFQVSTTTNQGIFVINSSGNVGIGTTTPSQKLSVAGTIESSSGGFKFPDGSSQVNVIGLRDSYRNLVIRNNTSNPNYQIDISADEVILQDTSGNPFRIASLSATADITASGANGLDTGSEAVSTWYHIWAIAKSDGTKATLLSTSTTSPTMPSGYTYKAYLGAVYNDGSGNFISIRQLGNVAARLSALPLSAGNASSYTSVSLSTVVPSTAKIVTGYFQNANPSSAVYLASTSAGEGQLYTETFLYFSIPLVEIQTVYYKVASGSEYIYVSGWEY